MKKTKKYKVKSLIIVTLVFMLLCGCSAATPTTPGVDPNPDENPVNSEVSYIEVTSSASTMNTGETMKFVVKGYNSDSEQVIIDKSKIVLWKVTAIGIACWECIEGSVHLNPTSNSFTTSFSSGKAATFSIGAYYRESAGADAISDFKIIQVTSKVKTIYDINSKK